MIKLVKVKCNDVIKGWKNALSDLSKYRAENKAEGMTVKLVQLNSNGAESKMHDATKKFSTEQEAEKEAKRIQELNPTRNIKYNLYVNGVLKKKV